jgi:hypothetical protein
MPKETDWGEIIAIYRRKRIVISLATNTVPAA